MKDFIFALPLPILVPFFQVEGLQGLSEGATVVAAIFTLLFGAKIFGIAEFVRYKLLGINGGESRRGDADTLLAIKAAENRGEQAVRIIQEKVLPALADLEEEPKDDDDIQKAVDAKIATREYEKAAADHRQRSQEIHDAFFGPNGIGEQMRLATESRDRQTHAMIADIKAITGIGSNVNLLTERIESMEAMMGRFLSARGQ